MADNVGVACLPVGRDSSDPPTGLDKSSPYNNNQFYLLAPNG
ncbi:MAG: hypothetical protein NTX71_00300 [Candidatus Aureabacteria bacterium]|nr:hypothetical protein [Candidatus Auribacterota bacterium]